MWILHISTARFKERKKPKRKKPPPRSKHSLPSSKPSLIPIRVECWRANPQETSCLYPTFPSSCPVRSFRNFVSSTRHIARSERISYRPRSRPLRESARSVDIYRRSSTDTRRDRRCLLYSRPRDRRCRSSGNAESVLIRLVPQGYADEYLLFMPKVFER